MIWARILRTVRHVALAAVVALTAVTAHGEGGDNPLVFPQRATIDIDTPVFAGESVFTVGTTEIIFAPNMGVKGRFTGYVRLGSAVAPLKGKLVCKKGKWVFKATAKDKLNGKPDLTIKLKGEIGGDGRDVTGTGSITQKSTSTKVKNANLVGRLAGNFAPTAVQLQFHFEPNAPAGTAPELESFIFTPEGLVSLKKFKCRAKPGEGGVDKVKITTNGKNANVKFTGTNDGITVNLLATGKIGAHKFKDYPVSFPNLPAARPNAFETGTGSRTITIPANGCLTSDVVVTTSGGVELTIASGTKLRTLAGALIRGRVRIRVADGGGARLQPGETIADGSVQVLVDLLDDSDAVQRVVTAVYGERPPIPDGRGPLTLDISGLSLGGSGGGGGGARFTRTPGDFVADALPSLDPIAADANDFEWEDIQPRVGVTYALGAERRTLMRNSAPLGDVADFSGELELDLASVYALTYYVPPESEAPPGPSTDFEMSDGTDTSEFPRFKYIFVQTPDGTNIGVGGAPDPGGTLDDTVDILDFNGKPIGEVEMTASAAKRILRWTSPHLNRVRLRVVFCDDQGAEFTRIIDDGRGDDGELVTVGSYAGEVRICLNALGGYNGEARVLVERAFRNSLPDTAELSQARWLPGPDGLSPDVLKWTLGGYQESVRNLRGVLEDGGFDVTGVTFEYAARSVTITQPPSPMLIYGNLDEETVQFLDVGDVQPLQPAIDVGGRPDFAKLNRNKCRAHVIVGKFLYILDAKRRAILYRVKLKGTGTGLAVDATGALIYVATDKGTLEARDAIDGHVVWSIDTFPRTFLTSIYVPHDGGNLWMTAPLEGKIYRIDTTRHTAPETIAALGVQSAAASHSQEWLAYTNLQAGTVVFRDLINSGAPRVVPSGGDFPVHPVWSGDDTRVYTGNQGSGSIGVIDPDTFLLDSIVLTVGEPNLLGFFTDFDNRVHGFVTGGGGVDGGGELFADGFESGDVTAWSTGKNLGHGDGQ